MMVIFFRRKLTFYLKKTLSVYVFMGNTVEDMNNLWQTDMKRYRYKNR